MSNTFGTREITVSPSSPLKFAGAKPTWLHIFGAGTVVMLDEGGERRTYVSGGGEIITGPFGGLVSFTCTKIRLGAGEPPNLSGATAVATNSTVGGVQLSTAPASAATPIAVGVNDPSLTNAGLAIYGDGSDGALAFDGSSTVLGLTPTTNVYTLARDIFASSISVAAGVTVYAAGFRIFCTGTTTLAATGKIHNNGHDASADTQGAVTNASGSTGVGTAGGAGVATSTNGNTGTNHAAGFPGGTGRGGAGGGDGTNTGGAAGTWAALGAVAGGARYLTTLLTGVIFGTATSGTAALASLILGGTGGGSGSADSATTTKSGGGGGGGGVLILASQTVVNNGAISTDGGKGGDAASTGHNAGGGGGGGGGTLIVISRHYSGSGTTTAAAGAGGAKAGTTGVAGTAGTAGNVILAAA